MRTVIDQLTRSVTISCTVHELYLLHAGRAIYGIPAQGNRGRVVQVYMDSRPHFTYDRVVASLEDFLAAEGWDMLENFDPADPNLNETTTITVPMDRRHEDTVED
jgi:hypothetical protein